MASLPCAPLSYARPAFYCWHFRTTKGHPMKALYAALLLALAVTPVLAADIENHSPHPFDIRDLVTMDRVSDPQLSPDGRYAAFSVRSTDYAANKGVNAIYVQDLEKNGQPVKVAAKGGSARWSADGH